MSRFGYTYEDPTYEYEPWERELEDWEEDKVADQPQDSVDFLEV